MIRDMGKTVAGRVTALLRPQCRFENSVFLLGHMRSGSTALSNILCSRPEISGYGEAHIRYDGAEALGILSLNHQRRKALRRDARFLFDKILHSRYDTDPAPGFFDARAIFLLREPVATIVSIRNLFRKLESHEYATDSIAADYYEQRLEALMAAWERFPPAHRVGFSYDQLTACPETALSGISAMLELTPPLANSYVPKAATLARGAGDPLASHRFSGIVASVRSGGQASDMRALDIPQARQDRLAQIFAKACATVTQS